jgi:hypothetical protein
MQLVQGQLILAERGCVFGGWGGREVGRSGEEEGRGYREISSHPPPVISWGSLNEPHITQGSVTGL